MKRYAVSQNSFTGPTIEAGKRYEVRDWEMDETDVVGLFNILTTGSDGEPFTANCLAFFPCAFLEGEHWTIIETEEPSDDN